MGLHKGSRMLCISLRKRKMCGKFLDTGQRTRRQMLAGLGHLDSRSFHGKLWKDDTLQLLPKGLTCFCRDLRNSTEPPVPFKLLAATNIYWVGNDWACVEKQGTQTVVMGKQTHNLPCGDALRQNGPIYHITASQQFYLRAADLAQVIKLLKAKPVYYWIVHPSIFLD